MFHYSASSQSCPLFEMFPLFDMYLPLFVIFPKLFAMFPNVVHPLFDIFPKAVRHL
jgi:hypothetical protein